MTAKSKWTGHSAEEIAALSAKNRAAQNQVIAKWRANSWLPTAGNCEDQSLQSAVTKPKKAAKTRQDVPTESQEQQAVITWWNAYAPTVGLDYRLLVAIPNGSVLAGDAGRRAMQSARLKREGMRAGYPDLQLDVKRGFYGGLKIEMKRQFWREIPSDKHYAEQKEYLKLLHDSGYRCITAAGADVAINAIMYYVSLG